MTPISSMDVSARLRGVCHELGIKSLEELLSFPEKELLKAKNFGRSSLAEVRTLRKEIHDNIAMYEFINKEVGKALSSQWNNPGDFLPSLDGDVSEKVLVFDGNYKIAQYHRYKGWTANGETIDVSRWMKIPTQ